MMDKPTTIRVEEASHAKLELEYRGELLVTWHKSRCRQSADLVGVMVVLGSYAWFLKNLELGWSMMRRVEARLSRIPYDARSSVS